MSKDFAHLHLHSTFSTLDSVIQIPALVSKCVELGMSSVAVTDHGVVNSSIRLYENALEKKIRPLIGCEVYLSPTDDHTYKEKLEGHPPQQCYHLNLLAMNSNGVKQLYKLSSIGYLEGFYYKPRVSLKLIEDIGKDLIILSACLKGPIAWNYCEDKIDIAKSWAARMKESFKGRFFLEFMDHGLEAQKKVNEFQLELSKEMEIPWVPTNDAHFLERKDHYLHRVILALGMKEVLQNSKMNYSEETYFKSRDEMEILFGAAACDRTLDVSNMIDIKLELGKTVFPNFEG